MGGQCGKQGASLHGRSTGSNDRRWSGRNRHRGRKKDTTEEKGRYETSGMLSWYHYILPPRVLLYPLLLLVPYFFLRFIPPSPLSLSLSISLSIYLSIYLCLSLSVFLCPASTLPFIIPSSSHSLLYPCLYPTVSVSLIPEFRSRGRLIMQGPFSIHLKRRNALLLVLSIQRRHSYSTRIESIYDVRSIP